MALSASGLEVGDRHSQMVADDLPRTQLVQYSGASGDYNPLHSDEPFAREVAGYPGVFGHGMLTMALTGRMLTDWVGDGRLLDYGVRFVAQVWPGDTLTATATVRELGERDGNPIAVLDVATTNQAGKNVVTGTATVRLDP
jgi:acyl dehydratase